MHNHGVWDEYSKLAPWQALYVMFQLLINFWKSALHPNNNSFVSTRASDRNIHGLLGSKLRWYGPRKILFCRWLIIVHYHGSSPRGEFLLGISGERSRTHCLGLFRALYSQTGSNLLCLSLSRHSPVPAQLGPTKTALYQVPRSNPIDHIHVDFRNIDYAPSFSLIILGFRCPGPFSAKLPMSPRSSGPIISGTHTVSCCYYS